MRQRTYKTFSLHSLCLCEGIFCQKKNQSIQKNDNMPYVLAKYLAAITVFSMNYSITAKTNQVQYP